ncbi:hypothetical protein CHGG_01285 [Chaetomium globosum CBS 148.51]|uniref:Prolyl 4-hydroxylase alpha subunit domain-containing protein n=1 Tax=Chaetomium globosum (strain ATCC 6205 / CBS 148.51 / DSM 1962 / NBRC 6347 / NRRL 1970) TaxID=306901 RepID=Q2HER9_CHAGB|nr:uncharacterized protein CHGG_01285 [Chaetomium globosum CBS 148.51]EAQ93050.1 hypothetical protein CHGG_01285 [Chaetomium globosum CBS 148.51]
MTTTSIAKSAGFWAGGLLLGLSIPYLPNLSSPHLASFIGDFPIPDHPFPHHHPKPPPSSATPPTPTAPSSSPSTPLIIYIHNILTPSEITSLLATAEPKFAPSQVTKHGRKQQTNDRTSSSAGLPRDDPAVRCVLDRARTFLGTMLRDGWDEMGPPQLVRYSEGQRFNVHHDWYDVPQWAPDGTTRKWNRVASFFAILEDQCEGGETHFPFVEGIVRPSPYGEGMWKGGMRRKEGEREDEVKPLWREHEEGGLAFRPVAGNAVFWVNLHANDTGDMRTRHAGLPLESGRKTAMNIWPRRYYAYE